MDAEGIDKNSQQYMALQREIIDTENDLKRCEGALSELNAELNKTESEASGAVSGMEKFQSAMQSVSDKAAAVSEATARAAEKTRALSAAAASALAALLGAGYKAATAADDLNALAKQTGFTTEELQMMQYAAGRIDVPMETITKAAAKMTKTLSSSEDSFTDLGVATRDAQGNFRSTSDIFYDTIQALSQIENETERDMLAMKIFGKSANELAGIIDDGGESLREFGKEAKDAGLILDQETLDGLNEVNDEIDRLKAMGAATIAKVGAKALKALTPVLEKVAQKVERLLEFVGNLSPKALGIIMTVLAITASLSPMLMMVSKVSKGISLFTGGLAKLAPALAGIGGPVLAIVAVIAVLTAAFVHLWRNNEEFREKVTASWNSLREKFSEFGQGIVERLNSLGFNFSSFGEVVRTAWDGLCNYLGPTLETAFSAITTILGTALDVMLGIFDFWKSVFAGDWAGAWNAAKSVFSTVWEGIESLASTIWEGIKNTAETIWPGISEAVVSAWDSVTSTLSGVWNSVKSAAITAWNGIKTAITAPMTAAQNLITTASGWKDLLVTAWNSVKTIAGNIWGNIKDSIVKKFTATKTGVQMTANNIKSALSTTWSSIQTAASSAWDTMKTTATTAWDGIKTAATQKWNAIKTAITGPISAARTTLSGIVSGIKSLFPINIGNILSGFKLPHFTLKMAPMTILGKTYEIPKGFDVQWYAKAMDNAWILNGASIFGAMGGRLLGGGEAGKEVVVSYDKLAQMMGGGGDQIEINVTINAAHVQNDAALAEMVARRIQDAVVRKGAVWA